MNNKMKILSICGSPRKGNSEAIINRLKEIFEHKGIENEVILLRRKNIQRCNGCVEYCNKNLKCSHGDDMSKIINKMIDADGYVFVSPNYFAMPPQDYSKILLTNAVCFTHRTIRQKNQIYQKNGNSNCYWN